ncbi:MAG: alkaline phosphatase family protein [Candidatus Baltobacteraceae bacterium]
MLRVASTLALSAILVGCGGSGSLPLAPQPLGADAQPTTHIRHVVIVIQENRSFNNLFATFPGTDGTTTGKLSSGKTITLVKGDLKFRMDLNHTIQAFQTSRDGGKMDGFDQVGLANGRREGAHPFEYTNPAQIKPYWEMASQYVLAEHMFQTQGSSSFTAHQDLIAGGTLVAPDKSLVNLPTCLGETSCVWGCDAPKGTRTSLITKADAIEPRSGPFPCLTYATLRDLLDAKRVSWKYYVPPICCNPFGRFMSAFDAIKAVRYGPEWKTNISSPQTNIFKDVAHGELPAVSWLVPDAPDSDHPGPNADTGPEWVASVVNAIGKSSAWQTTAIVVVWDDWGGFYDNVNPRQFGYGSLGFRVPAIVISPYAKAGYISKTDYEFGSILRFIEDNWQLGRLGKSDVRARSIADCFDFQQRPRRFKPIQTKYPQSYFENRPPSFEPPDTDF